MANWYIRSGATGAGTGADWANAFTTLAAAFAAGAAGDTFFVSDDHAETQASALTLQCPATFVAPSKVLCVNHLGSVPPVSADLRTTATVTTTGANPCKPSSVDSGCVYWYGINFVSGSGSVAANTSIGQGNFAFNIFEKCSLSVPITSGCGISLGSLSCRLVLKDFTYSFGSSSTTFWSAAPTEIIGSFNKNGGSTPSALFSVVSGLGEIFCRGADLSDITNKLMDDSSSSNNGHPDFTFENCKLNGSFSPIALLPNKPVVPARQYTHCTAIFGFTKAHYYGSETAETTVVRTGGASDGTTAVSKKITTTANVQPPYFAFEAIPIYVFNEAVGSAKTLTVEGIWGGGAVPNNDDVWMEVEYLGDATSPKSSIVTCGKVDALVSNAALTSSASSWGGGTTAFKMSVSFTPQQKGPVIVRIKAAKPSTTFYIDPKVAIA